MTEKLLQREAQLIAEMETLAGVIEAEGRLWTAEERERWDNHREEIGRIRADIERMRGIDLRRRPAADPVGRIPESRDVSPRSDRDLLSSDEYADVFRRWMRGEEHMDRELRALGATTGSSGGYTVPTVVYGQIWDAVRKLSPVVNLVRRLQSDAWKLNIPTMTALGGFAYVTEGNAPSANDPTIGQLALDTFTAQWTIGIDHNLEASAVDVDAWIAGLLAEGLAQFLETAVIQGAGSTSAIQGIMVGGTVAETTASATAITRAELEKVYWAMPESYLEQAVWTMAGSTAAKIAAIANSVTGDYLWAPSMTDGYAWKINGRPVYLSGGAPAFGANKVVAAFFVPGSYVLKDGGLQIAMSEHANFEKRQNTYRAVWTGDGDLLAATHSQNLKTHA